MAVGSLNLNNEVVDSKADAADIAIAHSSKGRYKYKAKALLAGYAALRPFQPVHLVGLADNMSGVWVVIEVTHVFDYKMPYTMKVTLGSNDALLKIPNPAILTDIEYQTDVEEDSGDTSVEDVDTFIDAPGVDSDNFWIDLPPDTVFQETPEYQDPDPLADTDTPLVDPVNIGKCRLNVWRAL